MLPANAYPELIKYPQLIGNFGGAWQVQQREFDHLPGAILMTTNCLMEPRRSYSDRLFTTGAVGFPDIPHIAEVEGKKDFTPVIQKALSLCGWAEDEPEKRILTGFGRTAVLNNAIRIASALADAFQCGVNDLPLTMVLSWYEQKAV